MSTMMEEAGAVSGRHFSVRRFVTQTGPGLLLCAAVAMPAYELSRYSASLDALATSLILGIVLRNVLGPGTAVQPGVKFASALFVPVGIVLYGTRLDFQIFSRLPIYTTLAVFTSMAAFYLVMLLGTRIFGVNRGTGLLIASGSAICGASAIAVLSPVVGARSRDMSMALIVTTTAGLTGALIYPMIADSLSLSNTTYGIFCGSTLQQMGIVRLAAAHLGDSALSIATSVKMMRITMLAPMTVVLAATAPLARGGLKMNGNSAGRRRAANPDSPRQEAGADSKPGDAWRMAVRRVWFLPVFVIVALVFSFVQPAMDARQALEPAATICLALALAGIGLTVDFESIKSAGSKPLLLGFAGWAVVGCIFLFAMVPLFSLGG